MTSFNEKNTARDTRQDFVYDNDAFVQVLIKMIGKQKKADFAAAANLSASHISRILQGKLVNRPTRHTVTKLASATTDMELLRELYNVTGYKFTAPTEAPVPVSIPADSLPSSDNKHCEHFFYLMMDYLTYLHNEKNIRWILANGSKNSETLTVTLPDGPVDVLQFTLVNTPVQVTNTALRNLIYLLYGQLAVKDKIENTKTAFVTTSEELFNSLIHMPPLSLNSLVSVILVDLGQHEIIKESYLDSHLSSTKTVEIESLSFTSI